MRDYEKVEMEIGLSFGGLKVIIGNLMEVTYEEGCFVCGLWFMYFGVRLHYN